jgi:inorganic triphosphatase YgiF
MMQGMEIELKFQAPATARAGLLRAFSTATSRTVPLQALYFDTADERLAGAGLALRLRKEGRRWVQTLKGRGDGVMNRLEHEVVLQAARGTPQIDIQRHAGTPAGQSLAALLADGIPLQARYATHIRRRLRRVRAFGAWVEVAFDEGRILAGEHRLPVCEVEFELLSGPPAALPALAALWVRRHGLWIDVRTKSERGHRLALGMAQVPALKAQPMRLPAGTSTAEAFAAMLQSALAQALPNAAEITSGQGGVEHLHQLRVGLRRLRSALRLFAAWSADPGEAAAIETELREPFTRLGAARDRDVLQAALRPALERAGGPLLDWPSPPSVVDPTEVLREAGFTLPLLRALKLALVLPPAQPGPHVTLAEAALDVLLPLWKQMQVDAKSYARAEVLVRHRTRRRLKRLRYAVEFLLPVLPRKRAMRALAALRDALEALGNYNDAVVAAQIWREQAALDPHAWFAVGWLAAHGEMLLQRTAGPLQALRELPRPAGPAK